MFIDVPENIILKYITSFIYGSIEWSYFPYFLGFAYPLSGVVLYQLQKNLILSFLFTQNKVVIWKCVLLFLAFTIKYAMINVSSNLQQYYHHGLLFLYG